MKHLVLYCLLGSLSLGCTEHGMESDSLKAINSERVITTRLVDMSRWGIHEVNGFVKRGDRIVVEREANTERSRPLIWMVRVRWI